MLFVVLFFRVDVMQVVRLLPPRNSSSASLTEFIQSSVLKSIQGFDPNNFVDAEVGFAVGQLAIASSVLDSVLGSGAILEIRAVDLLDILKNATSVIESVSSVFDMTLNPSVARNLIRSTQSILQLVFFLSCVTHAL